MPTRPPAKRNEIADGFRWRTQDGDSLCVTDISTSHLYHTLVMIWNHTMPMKTHNYNRYYFGASHSDDYMKKAIRFIMAELSTRTLNSSQKKRLNEMCNYLKTHQIETK